MFKDFATDSNEASSQQYVGSLADVHTDKYTLLLGDCLARMKEIPDGSVDMILCDLPFNTTRNHWDVLIPFEPLWEQYKRVIKPNGAILLFAQTPFDKVLGCSNLDMLKYEWIWEKTNATGHLNAKKMPMKAHENILVFYDKLPTYNPQKTQGHPRKQSLNKNLDKSTNYGKQTAGTSYDSTERYPRDVLLFKSDTQKSKLHPTQKPTALCEYLINTYTNEGDVVLDNCMGSGTSIVAALNTGRKAIGMEMSETYFNIATKRVKEAK